MQVCDNHVCDKAQDDESEDDADLEPLAVWEDHFEHRHLPRRDPRRPGCGEGLDEVCEARHGVGRELEAAMPR
jgi:hypothetical protein